MKLTHYLPTFKQLEPDNLLGLVMGHVVAQVPVKYTAAHDDVAEAYGVQVVAAGDENQHKFVENGILCTFDEDGLIVDYAEGKPMFIHFTEELNELLPARKYFAVDCRQDETFLRLVAVVPGTEWTTNVAERAGEAAVYAAAIAEGKIVVINDAATLPDGRVAKTYRCIA